MLYNLITIYVTIILYICYNSVKNIDICNIWNKIYIAKRLYMRIISGSARGTKLVTLSGENTRPTLDRVKEPLFSIIQNSILDACVLDLFAGSGALGLEALSRGAEIAVLCDNNIEAIKIINQNVEKTKMKDKAIVIKDNYTKCLETLKNKQMKFDLIFLDPPYKTNFAVDALEKILALDLLSKDGIIIIETEDEQREIKNIELIDININDIRKYGRVKLMFLSRKG